MSTETKTALDDALTAHIADEYGDISGAWVMVIETTNLAQYVDDRTSWVLETREKQSSIMTTGLLFSGLHLSRGDDD